MMDKIAEILASGAFTRQQAEALRLLVAEAVSSALGEVPDYLTQTEADALYLPVGATIDPWSRAVLASDFAYNSGTTEVDIPGLEFTPAANEIYLIEFRGSWSGSTTSLNQSLYMGLTWPTGMQSGSFTLNISAGNASGVRGAPLGGSIPNHGVTAPAINTPYPVDASGHLVSGATPSGAFKLRIRTNTAGSHVVTLLKGATLSWRTIP